MRIYSPWGRAYKDRMTNKHLGITRWVSGGAQPYLSKSKRLSSSRRAICTQTTNPNRPGTVTTYWIDKQGLIPRSFMHCAVPFGRGGEELHIVTLLA